MNNEVLRLHEREATNYETGEILNEAYNIENQRKINDVACLELDYPMDEKARLIQENMLISCTGQIYEIIRIKRTMDGRDIIHIVAEDMFSRRAKHTFLPNVPDMIGKKTSVVIKKALETAAKFSLYTDAELAALDMKWVGNDEILIDFFSTDKTSLWNFLHSVIENCGRGEIYSNGMKFALVERIGSDRGVRLSLEKNMQNISIERDTENIITRLYPFGSDDMHIGSVNGGKQYIDSPNKNIYGLHEGYKDYSDYTVPSKILANAKWEFDPKNEERIDIPKITITGNLIDLSKLEEYGDIEKVELGDTVHVYDVDGNEYTERVIEGTWYPFEPNETTISIGHMRRSDIGFLLYRLKEKKRELEAVQTTNKQITTRKIQGVVNSNRNPVKSENEKLLLDGDLLYINDDRNRRRIDMGNLNNEFVFNLYDKNGKPVIHFDEYGNGIFSGTIRGGSIESDTDIQVIKDVVVGQYLRVGFLRVSVNEGIPHYEWCDESGIILSGGATIKTINGGNSISISAIAGINLDADLVRIKGKRVLTESDLNDVQEEIETLKERIAALENK